MARFKLRDIFKKSAVTCTCSAAGGFAAAHAGCVIAPVLVAAAGAGAAGLGVPLLALAFGAVAAAGGLFAWHKIRGPKASRMEKQFVFGSAFVGFALTAVFHLASSRHDHHGKNADPRHGKEVIICPPPKPVTP